MGDAAIRIEDLRYRHPGARYGGHLLNVAGCVEFPSPGLTVLLGPSGSGKTTLLEILTGDRRGYEGRVVVDGLCLEALRAAAELQSLRRRIGIVYQDNRLFDSRTVRENVRLVVDDLGLAGPGGADDRIRDVLARAGLAGKMDERAGVLSGGEKRRVMLAKVLVRDARVILADEPTAGVEPPMVDHIVDLFARLATERAVVVVTHDERVARRCPTAYAFVAGRLVPRGAGEPADDAPVADVDLPTGGDTDGDGSGAAALRLPGGGRSDPGSDDPLALQPEGDLSPGADLERLRRG